MAAEKAKEHHDKDAVTPAREVSRDAHHDEDGEAVPKRRTDSVSTEEMDEKEKEMAAEKAKEHHDKDAVTPAREVSRDAHHDEDGEVVPKRRTDSVSTEEMDEKEKEMAAERAKEHHDKDAVTPAREVSRDAHHDEDGEVVPKRRTDSVSTEEMDEKEKEMAAEKAKEHHDKDAVTPAREVSRDAHHDEDGEVVPKRRTDSVSTEEMDEKEKEMAAERAKEHHDKDAVTPAREVSRDAHHDEDGEAVPKRRTDSVSTEEMDEKEKEMAAEKAKEHHDKDAVTPAREVSRDAHHDADDEEVPKRRTDSNTEEMSEKEKEMAAERAKEHQDKGAITPAREVSKDHHDEDDEEVPKRRTDSASTEEMDEKEKEKEMAAERAKEHHDRGAITPAREVSEDHHDEDDEVVPKRRTDSVSTEEMDEKEKEMAAERAKEHHDKDAVTPAREVSKDHQDKDDEVVPKRRTDSVSTEEIDEKEKEMAAERAKEHQDKDAVTPARKVSTDDHHDEDDEEVPKRRTDSASTEEMDEKEKEMAAERAKEHHDKDAVTPAREVSKDHHDEDEVVPKRRTDSVSTEEMDEKEKEITAERSKEHHDKDAVTPAQEVSRKGHQEVDEHDELVPTRRTDTVDKEETIEKEKEHGDEKLSEDADQDLLQRRVGSRAQESENARGSKQSSSDDDRDDSSEDASEDGGSDSDKHGSDLTEQHHDDDTHTTSKDAQARHHTTEDADKEHASQPRSDITTHSSAAGSQQEGSASASGSGGKEARSDVEHEVRHPVSIPDTERSEQAGDAVRKTDGGKLPADGKPESRHIEESARGANSSKLPPLPKEAANDEYERSLRSIHLMDDPPASQRGTDLLLTVIAVCIGIYALGATAQKLDVSFDKVANCTEKLGVPRPIGYAWYGLCWIAWLVFMAAQGIISTGLLTFQACGTAFSMIRSGNSQLDDDDPTSDHLSKDTLLPTTSSDSGSQLPRKKGTGMSLSKPPSGIGN
ncbi:Midasin [Diplonema papillatum]|nr:Midasin [Diplonema papillatum]KAJ9439113.1 Midasin [Diplonema papillatum]